MSQPKAASEAVASGGKVEEAPVGDAAAGVSTAVVQVDTAPLDDKQRAALAEMRSALQEADVKAGIDTRMPLDDACLCRYLRARDWNVAKAKTLLDGTLAWRRDMGVADLTCEGLETEGAVGKLFVRGHDRQGRPIIVMRPRLENTYDHAGNIRFVIYNLERAVLTMPPGVEKWVVLVDYSGFSLRNAPPMKTSMETLRIFQHHYPERLHHAYLLFPPWLFSGFWRVISPFIDSVTKAKVSFHSGSPAPDGPIAKELLKAIEPEQLFAEYGGAVKGFEYSASDYLTYTAPPQLVPGGKAESAAAGAPAEADPADASNDSAPAATTASEAGSGEASVPAATPEDLGDTADVTL